MQNGEGKRYSDHCKEVKCVIKLAKNLDSFSKPPTYCLLKMKPILGSYMGRALSYASSMSSPSCKKEIVLKEKWFPKPRFCKAY